jgi:leader peptidase (prepilin peptidase) / N-methyltransferase
LSDRFVSELIQLDPWALIAIAFAFGTLIGSFLNVVIYRTPVMMQRAWDDEVLLHQHANDPAYELPTRTRFNLLVPRSRCGSCGHQIGALENVPIVSWLVLRGKCSACSARISPRYPLVEALTGLLFAAAAWQFGATLTALYTLAFLAILVVLTGIDLDTQLLPDHFTLPLLWLGLIANLTGTFARLPDAVVGAIAGYLVLWSVFWVFKLATGREGMGYGDFKLLAALGAWFGWQTLPMILLVASVFGAFVGVTMIVASGKDRRTAIAFGPYLAFAGLCALFAGPLMRL